VTSDAENQQGMARRDFIRRTAAAGAIVSASNALANLSERAMAQEDEMILTVPARRTKELMDGIYHLEKPNMGYRRFSYSIKTDFHQPQFYQDYFKRWGLDAPKGSK
jgi:hypothetical protein